MTEEDAATLAAEAPYAFGLIIHLSVKVRIVRYKGGEWEISLRAPDSAAWQPMYTRKTLRKALKRARKEVRK